MRLALVSALAVAVLAVRAGTASAPVGHVIASDPAWSPDGGSIAFTQETPASMREAVVVASATGAQRRVVATDAATPKWSPDGVKIA